MIFTIINAVAMAFISSIWSKQGWVNTLLKFAFLLLAIGNGFEAYRFYILGA